jgi:hypothetical protein
MSPRRGSKPRRTDRLVVGRNVTLTLPSATLTMKTWTLEDWDEGDLGPLDGVKNKTANSIHVHPSLI